MATTLSIAEVISETVRKKTKEEKIKYLREHNSTELRNIFILTYDKGFELRLPKSVPPYKQSELEENRGLLYREARKLKYFVAGNQAGDNLDKIKIESLFIQMLENVHREDAVVLEHLVMRKPFKGLTAAIINEAFGEIIKGKQEN